MPKLVYFLIVSYHSSLQFPLLSKSFYLQKRILKADEEKHDEIHLPEFPGGPKAFEICAKFCYGMTVILNPYNVVPARCAAEYLGMTEDVDRGNLIYKIEVFLNSSIFRTWKDSIIVLQTSKSLLPWSEDLKIIERSINSIASKTLVDPSKITWSYTHNRKLAMQDRIVEHESLESVPKDWWVEDIAELDVNMYKRVMRAIKSKGEIDNSMIGEALKVYAIRWLPESVHGLISDDHIKRNKSMVETIISLLPHDRSSGCSCSFLLKLLKVALLVEVDDSTREQLIRRISLKLDRALLKDLLILGRPPQTTVYDVEVVISIVKSFVLQEKPFGEINVYEDNENGGAELGLECGPWLNVGRLVDGYLAEIGSERILARRNFLNWRR